MFRIVGAKTLRNAKWEIRNIALSVFCRFEAKRISVDLQSLLDRDDVKHELLLS